MEGTPEVIRTNLPPKAGSKLNSGHVAQGSIELFGLGKTFKSGESSVSLGSQYMAVLMGKTFSLRHPGKSLALVYDYCLLFS